jgi:hypothetical protein
MIRQVAVEGHADVADEQPPVADDLEPPGVDPQEAVTHRLLQLRQLLREVAVEVDVELPLDLGLIEPHVAHQPGDHLAADQVVPVDAQAAFDRQAALVDGLVVALQLLLVLRQAAAYVADRRGTDADHVATAADGVAHEVAVQPPVTGGARHLVFRQREVIHADRVVAGRQQPLPRDDEQPQLGRGVRHRLLVDPALVRLEPGHEGVGVERDAVRPQLGDLVDAGRERLRRLLRQPVDQVDVDRLEAERAAELVHLARLLLALVAAHRRLDVGIEILHPHRDAVEAEPLQQAQLCFAGDARVDLDRHLRVGQDLEVLRHHLVQPLDLRLVEVGRRAAAPVVLRDLAPVRQGCGDELDLALEPLEVGGRDLPLARDDDVAAAVEATLLAEREVQVERQRLVPAGVGGSQLPPEVGLAEFRMHLDGRRVRGVPRTRAVVLLEQRQCGVDRRGHDSPFRSADGLQPDDPAVAARGRDERLEGRLLQDVGDGILDATPDEARRAVARPLAAPVVRYTGGDVQRPFDRLDDVEHGDLGSRTGEGEAPVDAARRGQQLRLDQVPQDLRHEAGRDALGRGDLVAHRHRSVGQAGQVDHRPHGVVIGFDEFQTHGDSSLFGSQDLEEPFSHESCQPKTVHISGFYAISGPFW